MGRKLPYKEGEFFYVPLRTNEYAIGIIARSADKGKILFGYFFGEIIDNIPSYANDQLCALTYRDAVFQCMFGDLGLINGEWQIIGRCPNWKSSEWPLPPFKRIDPISGKCWLDILDENDLVTLLASSRVDIEICQNYPENSLYGYKAVETTLARLFKRE